MAVNYTNLFTDVGAFIKALDALRALSLSGGTLETQLANIKTKLTTSGREDVLSGVQELYDGMKDQGVSWAIANVDRINTRLRHRTTVLEELNGVGPASDVLTILIELYRDMVNNSQDIDGSVVTIGAVSADAGNTGNATVLTDKVLDGVSSPVGGGPWNPEWNAVNSELSVTETMTLTVSADSDSDGLVLGEEQLLLEGSPVSRVGPFGWETEGSGESKEIPTLNSHQLIANKDLESWNLNVPESWDLDSGVAGTNVIQETTAADVYRGDSALELAVGVATIQISQTLPIRILVPKQRYCLSCFVKGEAGILAGTLTIQFESPSGGYSAASSEKIEMAFGALAAQTSYGEEHFWINAPATIPDDLELVIKITGTLTAAKSVRIDSLAFGPVEWANGISVAVIAGSSQNVRGDRYSFLVTNGDEGTFQTYFRKQYKFQMPSQTDASETIADTLAE